jgi:hypothetical protein
MPVQQQACFTNFSEVRQLASSSRSNQMNSEDTTPCNHRADLISPDSNAATVIDAPAAVDPAMDAYMKALEDLQSKVDEAHQQALEKEKQRLAEALRKIQLEEEERREAEIRQREAEEALKRERDEQERRRLEEERRQAEKARREAEDRIRKLREKEQLRQKVLSRLASLGRCPAMYAWRRQGNGFQCEGGSHFASFAELNFSSADIAALDY